MFYSGVPRLAVLYGNSLQRLWRVQDNQAMRDIQRKDVPQSAENKEIVLTL